MSSLYDHPEHLTTEDYNQQFYDAIVEELQLADFDEDAFRAKSGLESGQQVVISDYWTCLSADKQYSSAQEQNRRAALHAGRAILQSSVDNNEDACILLCNPSLVQPTRNVLSRLLEKSSISLKEDKLVMLDIITGLVSEPYSHPVARLTALALEKGNFRPF